MERARLERSVTFSASHHYWHPGWSDERNHAVFGELTRSHEHEYRVTVWMEGPMDPVSGFCTDLPALEAAMEVITGPLRDADLNEVVEPFRDGQLLPSCENLARWVFEELTHRLEGQGPAEVARVRVAEHPDLAAEYPVA